MKPASLLLALVLGCSFLYAEPASAQFGGGSIGFPGDYTGVPGDVKTHGQPVVVTKGQNFEVHGVPGSRYSPDFGPRGLQRLPDVALSPRGIRDLRDPGLSLSFTVIGSGKISWLYYSGAFSGLQVNPQFWTNRVLGITYDNERLYLCVGRLGGSSRAFTGNNATPVEPGTTRPPVGQPGKPIRFAIYLLTFWVEDGSLLKQELLQPPKDALQLLTKDNLTAGPLVLSDNGVTCFNDAFVFEGKQLVRHTQLTEAQKPPNE